jgi:hypothetical protein
MAKTAHKYTPADEWWTVAATIKYLIVAVGLRDDAALDDLTAALFAGRIPMTVRRFSGGKLMGEGIFKASFLRDHMKLVFLRGKAYAKAIKALAPGRYECLLPARAVQMLWPPQRSKRATEQNVDRGRGWKGRCLEICLLECYPPIGKLPLSKSQKTIEDEVGAAWGTHWPLVPVPSFRSIERAAKKLPDKI